MIPPDKFAAGKGKLFTYEKKTIRAMLDPGKRCYLYHWQRITIPPKLSKSLIKPLFAPQETKAATRN